MNRLFLLGDSTCADKKKETRPETGWGEVFFDHIVPNWVVVNCAIDGYSSKDCIACGAFGSVLISAKPGDAALIQFGHNDEEDPACRPFEGYAANLKYMAQKLTEKGVSVYLVTPVPVRSFKEGRAKDTHGEYVAAMKYVAHLAKVPCVDITLPGVVELSLLGEVESRKYYMNFGEGVYQNYMEGKADNTHLRPEGARWVASMVADGLKALEPKPSFIA